MFQRCFSDGEYKQALGIAIESRRLDKVEESILNSGQVSKMLAYCLDIAMNVITTRDFRQSLLRTLVKLYGSAADPDYFGVTQCLTFLNDYKSVAGILRNLIAQGNDQLLVAYQLAFDLQDRAPQSFIAEVRSLLPQPKEATERKMDMEDVDEDSADKAGSDDSDLNEKLRNLHSILSGQVSISLYVDFLYRHNNTDMTILKNIKGSFERNSILHSATVTANAYMHAGTTVDQFLRDNLDWLGKALNWSKFSATASLGVIHKGQIKDSLNILKQYLPANTTPTQTGSRNQSGGSVYSEGGALFALGIIHSNHGDNMTDYLFNMVQKDKANPVLQHGACLGLGLSAMATGREDLYEALTRILYNDNAVSGEAAAIAIGLIMVGTAHERAVEEMKAYARETSHEKIIRGLAIGLALSVYGREEEADPLINELMSDKDPILRFGAMYSLGMAYCGTSNNSAIRKLLQVAVSDVSDDVRRAAVINLGFLLFKTPKQCPRLVSLLAESYNPHVRYGVAMAIGISCAGTGMLEAIDILESLASDSVDFVRQGALISLALVLMQFNENAVSKPNQKTPVIGQKVRDTRKKFESVWGGREEIMTKMGAILASGIIDAGGRNVTVLLHKNGHNKMRNIVGLMLFTQYWFWYPYLHFLSLSFEPTAIIGLNSSLKMPKWQFKSNARPSLFSYPAPVKLPEKQTVKTAPTAELSLTAKAKAREARKKKRNANEPFTPASALTATPTPSFPHPADQSKDFTEEEKKPEDKKEEEPLLQVLENPSRVTPQQIRYLSFDTDQAKYLPIKFEHHGLELGIVLLKHLKSDEKEEFVEMKNTTSEDNLPEPEAPAPFEWP
jgi:26S proteasome regulatory subunit N2